MPDIVEFLTESLAEDKRYAHAASGLLGVASPWHSWSQLKDAMPGMSRANCQHIERQSPARVLAEVETKQHVLARHRPATDEDLGWSSYVGACFGCGTYGEFADARTPDISDCPELRNLAAPYAERPGYKPAWRVV